MRTPSLDDDSTGYSHYPADETVMPYNKFDDLKGVKLTNCLVGVLSLEQIEIDSEKRLRQHGMEQSIAEKGYVDMREYADKLGALIRYAKLSVDGRIGSKLGLPGKTVHVYEYYGGHSPHPCAINGQLTLKGVDTYSRETVPFEELHPGIRYDTIGLKFQQPTILIDPYVCSTEAKEQDGIAHECFHLEEHPRFYLLQNHQKTRIASFNMTEDEYDAYEADRERYAEMVLSGKKSRSRKDWDEIDWVEWQARMGAVRRRMPRSLVRQKVQEMYTHYRALHPRTSDVKITNLVLNNLALTLHCSKEMTKIRMAEVGFDIARGSALFVGGKYVQTHKTSTGKIPRNVTYAISDLDATRLYAEDNRFRETLLTGKFVFADSFFCIDSLAYIEEKDGEKHLNDWALTHVDLCCLSFKINYQHRTTYFDKAALHSDNAHSDPITTALASIPLDALIESQADIDSKCADLPKTYGESLVYHRERLNVSQEELAWQLGMKRSSLRDYEQNRMFEPSRIFFASVGIILKLPGYYTKDMMKKAHCSLEFSEDALKHLDFVVTFMYMRSYEECQAVMRKFGLPPLLGRTEEEIEQRRRMRKGKLAGKDARKSVVSTQMQM